jgi:hypothetical protein
MKGNAMPAQTSFTPRLIGETEKTLNAILDRHLATAGLTEQHWITLSLAVVSAGAVDRTELVRKVSTAAKFSEADVQARVSELIDRQLLGESSSQLAVTDAGKEVHSRIRTANAELTERLWGDLPEADLDVTARVLATVLERANAEFRAV